MALQFDQPAAFQGELLPRDSRLVGYAALVNGLDLQAPLRTPSCVSQAHVRGSRLNLDDAGAVAAVDAPVPKTYFTGKSRLSRRHRVRDNLLGVPGYVPVEPVEMPDRLAQNLIMFIRQNGGTLPRERSQKEFAALTDDEVSRIEAIYHDVFTDSDE